MIDADGAPVAGPRESHSVDLLFRELDAVTPDEPLDLPFRWCEADGNGSFSAPCATRTRYLLLARSTERGPTAVLVDTTSGPVRDLRVVLEKSSAVTIVHQLARGDAVRIVNPDGLPVWFARVLDAARLRTRLPPGSYRVEVYRDRTLVQSEPIEVASEPLIVDLPS